MIDALRHFDVCCLTSSNIAEPNSAIPTDNGDLVLPEYNDGIAAEVVQAKTLTANDATAIWYSALCARDINCIPFAEFKEATGGTAQAYKDTLRLWFTRPILPTPHGGAPVAVSPQCRSRPHLPEGM